MEILKILSNFLFETVSKCFNILDIDMFGIGFTILDFFISLLLISIVFKFLGKGVNTADRFNLLTVLGNKPNISNNKRENQLSRSNGSIPTLDDDYDWLNED